MSESPAAPAAHESAPAADDLLRRVRVFITDLQQGSAVITAARTALMPMTVANWIKRELRWAPHWRTHYCGTLTHAEVVKAYVEDGRTQEAIAEAAGVSYQRVQQALRASGINALGRAGRRMGEMDAAQARRDLREARQLALDTKHYAALRKLWDEGWRIADLSRQLKTPASRLTSIIARCRKRYGWFPYRNRVATPSAKLGEPYAPP